MMLYSATHVYFFSPFFQLTRAVLLIALLNDWFIFIKLVLLDSSRMDIQSNTENIHRESIMRYKLINIVTKVRSVWHGHLIFASLYS
jgi:hypothetical protein